MMPVVIIAIETKSNDDGSSVFVSACVCLYRLTYVHLGDRDTHTICVLMTYQRSCVVQLWASVNKMLKGRQKKKAIPLIQKTNTRKNDYDNLGENGRKNITENIGSI